MQGANQIKKKTKFLTIIQNTATNIFLKTIIIFF